MSTSDTIQYFFEGDDMLAALWADMENARLSLSIEMYLWRNDNVGRTLTDVICRKAQAGLNVRVPIDGLGCRGLPEEFVQRMRKAGANVKRFHPLSLLAPWREHLNTRNHRKLILVDDAIAFIGSQNVTDASSQKYSTENRWQESHVRLTGTPLPKLVAGFDRSFRFLQRMPRRWRRRRAPHNDTVATRNSYGRNAIRRFLQRYIRKSRSHIRIATAYFLPDWFTLRLLFRALRRGVIVDIITAHPQQSDVPLMHRLNRRILRRLLKRGARVWFFRDRMYHSKYFVFDETVASIGSANLNHRSLFRDWELNLFVRKTGDLKPLVQQFETDIRASDPAKIEQFADGGLWERFLTAILTLIRTYF